MKIDTTANNVKGNSLMLLICLFSRNGNIMSLNLKYLGYKYGFYKILQQMGKTQ